ncbi:MAG: YafY family protein [Actinomycetota bacterium]
MDKTERHLNLISLLIDARIPVPLDRIREALYRDQAEEAFKRMFERDKEELRALGLAIEVEEIGAWGDQGYVIHREEVTLPELDLTPAEHAALMLAMQMWGEGTFGHASPRLAGMKLAATSAEAPPVPWILPHVSLRTPNVATITDALERKKAITFRYRSSGRVTASERCIEPHGIRFRGAWYVTGFDRDRGERRMFKLERIEGHVTIVGGAAAEFTEPRGEADDPMPGDIDPARADNDSRATVAVSPDLAWWAERRPGVRRTGESADGRVTLEVTVVDEERFVRWMLGFADAAEVLEPSHLREAVISALEFAGSS